MSKKLRKPENKEKDFSNKIIKILSQNSNKAFNYKQIATLLEKDDTKSRNEIIRDLKILASTKKIIESEPGKYLIKALSQDYYEGTIDMTGRKTAYFVCPELEEDVFIPTNNLNRALDKDIVKVYVYNRRKGRRPEGEVIEVVERKKTDFVGVIDIQKNFGFDKATGNWILSIDADEEVSPKLAEEIKKEMKKEFKNSVNGYYLSRKNIIFGKWIAHSGWYPDFQLRLFKKGKGKFTKAHVHEPLSLNGETKYLKNEVVHHNYNTLTQFLQKAINIYVPSEAKNRLDSGYVFSYADAIRFPLKEFLSRFFSRKGYKDGFHGLMLSMLMAFYHFLVFAKIWEINKFKDLDERQTREFIKNEFKKSKKELSFWFTKEKIDEIKNPLKKVIHKLFNKIS